MVRQALKKEFSVTDILTRLTAFYASQDIENVQAELDNSMPVEDIINQKLAVERNIVMAKRIDSLLHKESPLIAVGAGHLGTSTGLIKLLEKKGYKLKNIPFTIKKAHP
jgi:uncharacterized protein YbaP (TraB family)